MVKKVVIVGAGPCGLLLAHYLLRRGDRYQVEIYDRLRDPRTPGLSNARSFPIILSTRGKNALAKIDGTLEAVQSQGTQTQGLAVHQTKGKQKFLPFKTQGIAIDRRSLINSLLSGLTEKYDSIRLKLHFDCQCIQADVKTKQVKFQKQDTEEIVVDCDLLIGADGARSAVRNCFFNAHLFEFEQKYFRDDYKSLYFPSLKDKKPTLSLQANCIHGWRSKNNSRIVTVPQPDCSCSGTLIFERDNNEIVGMTTAQQVREFFDRNFPEASVMSQMKN